MRTFIARKLEKFERFFQALPVGSMNNFILIYVQRKTRCRKKILSEVILDFYARSSEVHWQIYATLRVFSQLREGISRSREMVP